MKANWRDQCYNNVVSLVYNNPHHVVRYQVRDESGAWVDRASRPAPVVRLFEQQAPPERECLRTIQFVHHCIVPPGGRHVHELHVHPDAEEIVVVMQGEGVYDLDGRQTPVKSGDVLYVPPGAEHCISNPTEALLYLLFINVPVGEALRELQGHEA